MDQIPDIPPQQGRLINGVHHFAVRVYYEDTDFSGYVFHANYLKYIERARSDMLARLGIDQRAAFAEDLGSYVVAEMNCRFMAPARFDDALIVESRLNEAHGATILIDQRVRRGEDWLFRADVRAAFIDRQGKPRRHPKEWTSAFTSAISSPTGSQGD